MKVYLSFDVGIKNLAYCKLDENKSIKDWGIINLNENPECDVHLKKKCEKQSSYIVYGDEKVKYCCSNHSKKFPKKKVALLEALGVASQPEPVQPEATEE